MTVLIRFARRVPKRKLANVGVMILSLVAAQNNMWSFIRMGMEKAQRQGKNKAPDMTFFIEYKTTEEDTFYDYEWIIVKIRGDEVQEKHEYNLVFDFINKSLVSQIPKFRPQGNSFLTKVFRIDDSKAFLEGKRKIGVIETNKLLLELGIISMVDLINDDAEMIEQIQKI